MYTIILSVRIIYCIKKCNSCKVVSSKYQSKVAVLLLFILWLYFYISIFVYNLYVWQKQYSPTLNLLTTYYTRGTEDNTWRIKVPAHNEYQICANCFAKVDYFWSSLPTWSKFYYYYWLLSRWGNSLIHVESCPWSNS